MTDDYYRIACLPATAGADGATTITVRLSGEFDLAACDDLRVALLGAVNAGGSTHIVVDLTDVDFLDSETVNVLLQGYLQAQTHGIDYKLTGAHGVVRRVLDIMGLFDITDAARPGKPAHLVDQPDVGR